MKELTSAQIFKSSNLMTQSDLSRLLLVDRSTINRAVKDGLMSTDDSGKKILIHEYETLSAIVDIMDRRLNLINWGTNEYKEYNILYQVISDEVRPMFMKRHYRG